MLVGEGPNCLENMMRELCSALRGIRGDTNFLGPKVGREVGVVHRKSDFNRRLIVENLSRQPEVQFLSHEHFQRVEEVDTWKFGAAQLRLVSVTKERLR